MNRNLTILILEDNQHDLFFLKRAFERCKISNPLQEAVNAVGALDYLSGKGQFADRKAFPFPSLIIANLRIGLEVLTWIRAHPEHYVIPVLLLQEMATDADLREAYRLGANACLLRPLSLSDLEDLLMVTSDFWARCAKPAMPEGKAIE